MSNTKTTTFPTCAKLTTKAQYRKVFDNSLRIKGKYWQVFISDTGHGCARLGLAVAKKTLRRAVDRNIYKRIAREVFRLHQSELDNKDFVIMATQKTSNKEVLRLELLALLDLLENT